jgi:PleD family two-component response regulator
MDTWTINTFVYMPSGGTNGSPPDVLRPERGFMVDLALSQRFFVRALDCYRFDVLAVYHPPGLDHIVHAWRAKRHSRFNKQTPLVIIGEQPSDALLSVLRRAGVSDYITLPASRETVRKQLAKTCFEHRGQLERRRAMPTAMSSLWAYPLPRPLPGEAHHLQPQG